MYLFLSALISLAFILCAAPAVNAADQGVRFRTSLHALDGGNLSRDIYEYDGNTRTACIEGVKRLASNRLQISFTTPVETVSELPLNDGEGISQHDNVKYNFWLTDGTGTNINNNVSGVELPAYQIPASGDQRRSYALLDLTFDSEVPAGARLNFAAVPGLLPGSLTRASFAIPGQALVDNFSRVVEEGVPLLSGLNFYDAVTNEPISLVYSSFDPTITNLENPISVNQGQSVSIKATADDGCALYFNGSRAESGSFTPRLSDGQNIVELKIEKTDGRSLTYRIYLWRDAASFALASLTTREWSDTDNGWQSPKTVAIPEGYFQLILDDLPPNAKTDGNFAVKPDVTVSQTVQSVKYRKANSSAAWQNASSSTSPGDGYYLVSLSDPGEYFISAEIAENGNNNKVSYLFSVRYNDVSAVMTKLELWRKNSNGTLGEKIPFDREFLGAPLSGLMPGEYISYNVPGLTRKCVEDAIVLLADTNNGTNIEVQGRTYYYATDRNVSINSCDYFEIPVNVAYGGSETVEFLLKRAVGASVNAQTKVFLNMQRYEPHLEKLSVRNLSDGAELLSGFAEGIGDYTVVVPYSSGNSGRVSVSWQALLHEEYKRRGYSGGNPNLKVYLEYNGNYRIVDNAASIELDVDRFAPKKLKLTVHSDLYSASGLSRESKQYSLTIKSGFTPVEKVYYGITGEQLSRSRDPANANVGLNGHYEYTTVNNTHAIQLNCFGFDYESSTGKPIAAASADKIVYIKVPFAWYPANAHDVGELVHENVSNFYVESVEYKDGEGTITLSYSSFPEILAEGVTPSAWDEINSPNFLRAKRSGTVLGALAADFLIPRDPDNHTAFSITTRDEKLLDLWRHADKALPFLDPAFTYCGGDSPLLIQQGQNITVSCYPSIRNYGQYLEFRKACPGTPWVEALTPGGFPADSYYGSSSWISEFLPTFRDNVYKSYYDCPLGFPHDSVEFKYDLEADPRYAAISPDDPSEEKQALRALLAESYANAAKYLPFESGADYLGYPRVSIQGLNKLPKGVDYLYLSATTKISGQKALIKVAALSADGIKSPSQLNGTALTVSPKYLFFSDNINGDEMPIAFAEGLDDAFLTMGAMTPQTAAFATYTRSISCEISCFGMMVSFIGGAIAQGLQMITELVEQFYARDGNVWIAWRNLEPERYSVNLGAERQAWAVLFEQAADGNPYHGVSWNLYAKSTYLSAETGASIAREFAPLRYSSGRSYPGIMGIFDKKNLATEDSAKNFFASYPELLPLVGNNPDNVKGKYGPYSIGVRGTLKGTDIEIRNQVGFFCVSAIKDTNNDDGTTRNGGSSSRSALGGARAAALSGSSAAALSSNPSSEEPSVSGPMPLVRFNNVRTLDDYVDGEAQTVFAARGARSVVALTVDLPGEPEAVIPTVFNGEKVVVRNQSGDVIPDGTAALFSYEETAQPAESSGQSAAQSTRTQSLFVEFDVPEGAINQAELVELLVKCNGDSAFYSVAPKGDGQNGGFRVDGLDPVTVNAESGGSGGGGGCRTAGLAGCYAALLSLIPLLRKRKGL
ncbi:MAG: hypothetical protein Q4D58_00790 [Synergistaceae bacterium]|nr:hypothetical protein [Synergistaceae bacterium]